MRNTCQNESPLTADCYLNQQDWKSQSESESRISQRYNDDGGYYIYFHMICPLLGRYKLYCHKLHRCFSCIKWFSTKYFAIPLLPVVVEGQNVRNQTFQLHLCVLYSASAFPADVMSGCRFAAMGPHPRGSLEVTEPSPDRAPRGPEQPPCIQPPSPRPSGGGGYMACSCQSTKSDGLGHFSSVH